MKFTTYKAAEKWLFSCFPAYQNIGAKAYKPGLENVVKLLSVFENPQETLRFIHVAGTNGKGSTCSFITSLLMQKGEKVGLFTSPHIFHFSERIRVNGIPIEENAVLDFCNRLHEEKLDFEPSFFEITLTMALVHFQREACTWVVLETGLGGRLDATNVVVPEIAVITNIGIDHTQFLGDTLALIAGEKAGIIKQNIPVVIGKRQEETVSVFEAVAKFKDASIIYAEDFSFPTNKYESYLAENWRTANTTLEVLGIRFSNVEREEAAEKMPQRSGLFGRMYYLRRNPDVLLDVSHNVDGLRATLVYLKQQNRKVKVIFGASKDKDIKSMLTLFPKDYELNLCTFSNERSVSLEELKEVKSSNEQIQTIHRDINAAIEYCVQQLNYNEVLLVTGSFFLIADVNFTDLKNKKII